jgi:hypothetical protein
VPYYPRTTETLPTKSKVTSSGVRSPRVEHWQILKQTQPHFTMPDVGLFNATEHLSKDMKVIIKYGH